MSLIAAVVLTVYMLAAPAPHTCPVTPSPDTIANISQFS